MHMSEGTFSHVAAEIHVIPGAENHTIARNKNTFLLMLTFFLVAAEYKIICNYKCSSSNAGSINKPCKLFVNTMIKSLVSCGQLISRQ